MPLINAVKDIKSSELDPTTEYSAWVIDVDDPLMLGRVRFSIPSFMEFEQELSPWAIPDDSCDGRSSEYGIFDVPPLGSNILVRFQRGSLYHPKYKRIHVVTSTIMDKAKINYPYRKVMAFENGFFLIVDTKTDEVFLENPGDFNIKIFGDCNLTVEGDMNQQVNGNLYESVTGCVIQKISGGVDSEIIGDVVQRINGEVVEIIAGNVEQTIVGDSISEITGNVNQTVTGNVSSEIQGTVSQQITGSLEQKVTGEVVIEIEGDLNQSVNGTCSQQVTGSLATVVDGAATVEVNGTLTHKVNGNYLLEADSAQFKVAALLVPADSVNLG